MLKPISVGNEYFNYLIKTGSYYVDKTPFIKTVFGENTSRVLLITRPRRFGKTLMMSTFYDFFSLGRDGKANTAQKEELFKETQIYKDRDFCNDFMGRFPVIFISLKSVTGRDFNEAYNQLAFLISSLAGNYR